MERRSLIAALGAATVAPTALAAGSSGPGRDVPLLSTYVAGLAYHGGAGAAARLRAGEVLVLQRRPDSPYDPRTVEIRTVDGVLLGHVPRIDATALANLMDAGFAAQGRVRLVQSHPVRPRVDLDIALAL